MRKILLLGTAWAGMAVGAADLAWKFDASARPADVTAVSSAQAVEVANSDKVAQGGLAIAFFDSRLEYTLLSTGWSFHVPRGAVIIFR